MLSCQAWFSFSYFAKNEEVCGWKCFLFLRGIERDPRGDFDAPQRMKKSPQKSKAFTVIKWSNVSLPQMETSD